jgi:hypothetical protein
MFSNPAKLMYAAEGLNHGPILHNHVPGEGDRVSELRVIADANVVRDMRVSHHQIVIADFGDQSAACGPAVDADKFAYFVSAPDARLCALPFVFQILRRYSDCRIRKEDVIFADPRDTFYVHMRHQLCPSADRDAGANNASRSDFSARSDLGA